MGVETFRSASSYKQWAKDHMNLNKEVISVVVFEGELVITWKYTNGRV
jgi:hypothetical protein